ncbi:MAG: restriction endonuclease subunit S [Smithella sp.]
MGRAGWKTIQLEHVLDALIDYRGKTPHKVPNGVPLITAKIVKNGFIQEPNEFIPEADYDAWMVRGFPQIGDVVLTTEAPLGEVAQIDKERVALAQRIVLLRGKKEVLDNGFLKYFLKSEIGQSRLKEKETGTTVTGIKQSELRQVEIDLPPIAVQRRIAGILSALDEKIELNRQTNATLEAIAQAIFKEWFVDFNFPSATGEMQDSALGSIPKGWRVESLSNVAHIYGGGTPKTSSSQYWNGDIPWFSVVDMPKGTDVFVVDTEKKITQAGLDNSSTNILPEGTTIISARGTVGKVALCGVPMAMNQSCYGLNVKQDDPGLYTYYLARSISLQLQKGANGSVFDTITRNTFEQLDVTHPSTLIIEGFNATIKAVMMRIKENLYNTNTLNEIRNSLLPKLMTGEIEI